MNTLPKIATNAARAFIDGKSFSKGGTTVGVEYSPAKPGGVPIKRIVLRYKGSHLVSRRVVVDVPRARDWREDAIVTAPESRAERSRVEAVRAIV